MAFNRGRGFRAELVSETVGVRAFHFIEQHLTNYYEMALMDKKEVATWARRWGSQPLPGPESPPSALPDHPSPPCRMHLALKAYQELLRTVQEMDRSPEPAVRDSSQVIKSESVPLFPHAWLCPSVHPSICLHGSLSLRPSIHVFLYASISLGIHLSIPLSTPPHIHLSKLTLPPPHDPPSPDHIFYLMEYRELLLALFRKFDETKQPRSFLRDLVETAHLFLQMLERFCRGRSGLVVQVGWGQWGCAWGPRGPS